MCTDICERLESDLAPLPDSIYWKSGSLNPISLSFFDKVSFIASQYLSFIKDLFLLPFSFCATKHTISQLTEPESLKLPKHTGFADSLFQTSGLGLETSQWADWVTDKKYFIDILNNPDPFIDLLKSMNVTAHRFSLEWSVIEPEKGQVDQQAIDLYRNFIQKLKENGIEPYVTLHHFVLPKWFTGFDKMENITLFQNHALKMIALFPEVQYWMTINEPAIFAFQSYLRGVYPPGTSGDITKCAQVMRSLLMAHCLIYKEAKEQFPEKQIGITHQWLKFEPLEGNPFECMVCYFLSKITHNAVFNFFKTGQFSLQMPLHTNVQFAIDPEEWQKTKFLDFIGVQFYGYPRFKMGLNGGEEHPGYKIQNGYGITIGSTCPKNGIMQSFGPSIYPESLNDCLSEAQSLQVPIVISEIGCDARVQKWGEKSFTVQDEEQLAYFQKILPILAKFQNSIQGLFIWTLFRGHLEWDRGDFPHLGVIDVVKDREGKVMEYKLSPAAQFLQKVFSQIPS